ncbi:MAG: macrocin-O-methyltransferase, partial [Phenylobacterium sp.]
FDCDLYAPTKAALEALWPKVSRGGVVLFDEYGIPDWPGETQAVDEFLADKPVLKLETFTWTNAPAAYLVKP